MVLLNQIPFLGIVSRRLTRNYDVATMLLGAFVCRCIPLAVRATSCISEAFRDLPNL